MPPPGRGGKSLQLFDPGNGAGSRVRNREIKKVKELHYFYALLPIFLLRLRTLSHQKTSFVYKDKRGFVLD